MKTNRKDDLEILENGLPFIRSLVAFLIYLRFGGDRHYEMADRFIEQLKQDLQG